MTKLTDASVANKSGKNLEKQLKNLLNYYNIPYVYQKEGNFEIDFIIQIGNKKIYVDCTNQNVGGSVEEKLPHKVWKYWKKYNFDEIYIIKGNHDIGKCVISHLKDDEFIRGYKTHIVRLEQFINIILDIPRENTSLERFMR